MSSFSFAFCDCVAKNLFQYFHFLSSRGKGKYVGSIRKFRKFINLPTDRSTSAAVIGHKITHKRASENDDICLFLFLLYLLYGAYAKMKKD